MQLIDAAYLGHLLKAKLYAQIQAFRRVLLSLFSAPTLPNLFQKMLHYPYILVQKCWEVPQKMHFFPSLLGVCENQVTDHLNLCNHNKEESKGFILWGWQYLKQFSLSSSRPSKYIHHIRPVCAKAEREHLIIRNVRLSFQRWLLILNAYIYMHICMSTSPLKMPTNHDAAQDSKICYLNFNFLSVTCPGYNSLTVWNIFMKLNMCMHDIETMSWKRKTTLACLIFELSALDLVPYTKLCGP